MKPLWIRSGVLGFAVSFASFAPAACGSAPDSSAFDDPGATRDGGTGGDTSKGDTNGGTDTSSGDDTRKGKDTTPADDTTPPPPDAPEPITLDNVCAKLADVICSSSTAACCTTRGISYDDGGCRSGVAAACAAEVEAAKSGKMTFDPTAFDACAAAWSGFEAKCSVPILSYVKGYPPCMQLFNGIGARGDSCTSASDCKASPGAFAECRSTSGGMVCVEFFIVGKDATCNLDGTSIHFCDQGLYCSPSTGVCRTQKPTGAACSGSYDTSCGFGNTCDWGNHCAPGAPMGASCSRGLECASWQCGSFPSYTCTDPNVEIATNGTCKGTP